jgi:limonene-1,2-epoxide hydrolase
VRPAARGNDTKSAATSAPTILPVAGVFVISDGKIKQWRDYFDLNTFEGVP